MFFRVLYDRNVFFLFAKMCIAYTQLARPKSVSNFSNYYYT